VKASTIDVDVVLLYIRSSLPYQAENINTLSLREIGLHRVFLPTLAGFGILSEKGKQESIADLSIKVKYVK
jgi:hypothetical protein